MKSGDAVRFGEFVLFLRSLVTELNQLSSEGWVVLVEGRRDAAALLSIGYRGEVLTMRSLKEVAGRPAGGSGGVVILTDSDRAGRQLAARCAKTLGHAGVRFSLAQRRRLLAMSKGVFRHVENLDRFSDALET